MAVYETNMIYGICDYNGCDNRMFEWTEDKKTSLFESLEELSDSAKDRDWIVAKNHKTGKTVLYCDEHSHYYPLTGDNKYQYLISNDNKYKIDTFNGYKQVDMNMFIEIPNGNNGGLLVNYDQRFSADTVRFSIFYGDNHDSIHTILDKKSITKLRNFINDVLGDDNNA